MNHFTKHTQIVGQYRKFGPAGPVYQVIGLGRVDDAGDQWLDIELVQTGEHASYKLDSALDDPLEA